MKCDELTPIDFECNMGKDINGVEHREPWKAYDIDEVNDAIAELKQKIEDAKDTAYADSVDAGMRERRLKRALWLARAERAADRERTFSFCDLTMILDIDGCFYDSNKKKEPKKLTARLWRIVWMKVERKCRAKAEEYK